jgi:hypothetical protein
MLGRGATSGSMTRVIIVGSTNWFRKSKRHNFITSKALFTDLRIFSSFPGQQACFEVVIKPKYFLCLSLLLFIFSFIYPFMCLRIFSSPFVSFSAPFTNPFLFSSYFLSLFPSRFVYLFLPFFFF